MPLVLLSMCVTLYLGLGAMTGGALDNDELAPGPIMIQGDHSRVSFRKLVVTPIIKAGT